MGVKEMTDHPPLTPPIKGGEISSRRLNLELVLILFEERRYCYEKMEVFKC